MAECKHGLKQGCYYCHPHATIAPASRPTPKRRTRATRLSEQMNERMTTLKRRLQQLRGE